MKTKILIVFIAAVLFSLAACNKENGNVNSAALKENRNSAAVSMNEAADSQASVEEKTSDTAASGKEKEPNNSAASAKDEAVSAESKEVTAQSGQITSYSDYMNTHKNNKGISSSYGDWTDVRSLVLTDGANTVPNTEIICGEKFLSWTLKSASLSYNGKSDGGDEYYNIKASFDGEATAKGTLEYNKDLSGELENKIVFRPQKEYYSLFPKAAFDTNKEIWFIIDDSAKQMLGIKNQPCEFNCEIIISEYNIFKAPIGGAADKVKIKKATIIVN